MSFQGIGFGWTDVHVRDFAAAVAAHWDDHRHRHDPLSLTRLHVGGVDPQVWPIAFDGAIQECMDALVDFVAQERPTQLKSWTSIHQRPHAWKFSSETRSSWTPITKCSFDSESLSQTGIYWAMWQKSAQLAEQRSVTFRLSAHLPWAKCGSNDGIDDEIGTWRSREGFADC